MRLKRSVKGALLLVAVMLARPIAASQPSEAEATLAEKVDAVIRCSPRYGPFDLISFEVTGDTVTLGGEVFRATLKKETEKAVGALPGVARVVNSIEVLPVSFSDNRLRRAVFLKIYRDSYLSKYGTPVAALGPGRGRAMGVGLDSEPLGNYAIHVVVKGGRVTLYGHVDNDVDREKAAVDARGVFGVMAVENRIELTELRPAA